MIGGESQALVVNTNQVQHFAARLNRHPFLTQDANPLRGKKSRDGIFGLCIDLMVAEATENPNDAVVSKLDGSISRRKVYRGCPRETTCTIQAEQDLDFAEHSR